MIARNKVLIFLFIIGPEITHQIEIAEFCPRAYISGFDRTKLIKQKEQNNQ